MACNKYTEETKAQVMAALLTGQSVSEVAKTYDIPRGTVANWSADRDKTLDQTQPNTKKEIGELLVEYLKASILALKAQAEVFGDKQWLTKQPASELGVLHGIAADKAVRLLEALSRDVE